MKHEYYLIKRITTIGHKNPIQVVDKTQANTLTQAEKIFKVRNNFSRILEKADLTICKSERFYQ